MQNHQTMTTKLGTNQDGTPKKDTRGRPRADHQLTRTSILADGRQMEQLKQQAAKEGRHMYELYYDAVQDYLLNQRATAQTTNK
jgi:hypothetical protein